MAYESALKVSENGSVAASAEKGGRVGWVETASGVGILLVVFGHAWRGLYQAGILSDPWLFQTIDQAVYSFHMPLFFFLGGLFLEASVRKSGVLSYVAKRARRLLWPLTLWTWIFATAMTLAASAANNPIESFPVLPLPPYKHYWFLWALFLLCSAAALAVPLVSRFPKASFAGLVAGAIALYLTVPVPEQLRPLFLGACRNAPFLLLGMVWARALPSLDSIAARACAAVVFVAAVAVGSSEFGQEPIIALLVATAAVSAIALFLNGLGSFSGQGILRQLGAASMAIYLSHTIFSAAFRIGLQQIGVTSVWLHLLVGVLVGVLGPLALLATARRLRLERVLGF